MSNRAPVGTESKDADVGSSAGAHTVTTTNPVRAKTKSAPPSSKGQGMQPGATVGRYRLLSLIATGGMAQVWIAKPEASALSRTVAIKLVRPELAADEEYSRMFIDEAMAASAIHHPNVCEIEELGRDGDLLFMVLEWVPGVSLARILQVEREIRPIGDDIAARIVADACAGLHAAHEAAGPDGQPLGLIHRDVSPPNILISTHGHVKVTDFGIAKARYQLHSRTRTGELKGKVAYLAPERILGRGTDHRSDIYALGGVLYLATLGQRPFGAGMEALTRITRGQYRLPHALRPDFPKPLEAIIVRALATDPEKRFGTALEMQLELEQWLVASSRPTTSADIVPVFRERVGPEGLKALEALMGSTRPLPHELASRLLRTVEKNDTPTAIASSSRRPVADSSRRPEERGRDSVREPADSSDDLTLRMVDVVVDAPATARSVPDKASGRGRPRGTRATPPEAGDAERAQVVSRPTLRPPRSAHAKRVRRSHLQIATWALFILVVLGVAAYGRYVKSHHLSWRIWQRHTEAR